MTSGAPVVSNEELLAFADGRLDPARSATVDAWLKEHADEAQRVEEWRRQNALLKAALDPVAEEPVPPALTDVLQRRRLRRTVLALASAAAAAIVAFPLGIALGWYLTAQGMMVDAGERLAATGISTYRVYAAEVRHPVEVWADEEQHLVSWLTKRLGVPVKSPDLSRNGLKLVGGRLHVEDDAPLALLMYEDDGGRRFTLLVEHIRDGRQTAFRYVEKNDAGAFYWVEGEVGYALTGPADRTALLKVAETVYEQLNPE
ncbi:MAG: anti-sigma factor family protein [Propylenella sp.]